MKKPIIISVFFFLMASSLFPQAGYSEISSMPGAFSRLGFGARGIGMGNAMSSITEGNLVSYYNPALSAFQQDNSFAASYSFLSLDRTLNFLNFTKRFELKSKSQDTAKRQVRTPGLSFGIINAGVTKIDGRDNQGMQTGDLSTSENQFFLSFSNRFSEKLAIGLAVKFYYFKLYEKITTSGIGFDIGALYTLSGRMNLSLVLTDLNSKYKWDTAPVRQESGKTTENKFPIGKKVGLSYRIPEYKIIASAEFEGYGKGANFLRFGAEYNIYDQLFLRGGIDKLNLSNKDYPARPAVGFSYFKKLSGFIAGIDYAFVPEPYSSSGEHILGINVNF
ncbi:MAG: hypothetical protein ACM3UR_04050 [Bacteroidota bacterium]|nr:hypothetical protein [Ignavibacteria bacterium]MCU7519920.1 hypothetical protein [Ignavibacteria bacterium]